MGLLLLLLLLQNSIYYHPTLNPFGAPPPGSRRCIATCLRVLLGLSMRRQGRRDLAAGH